MRRRFSLIILLLVAASLGGANVFAQSQTHRAAVVARFTDDQYLTRCVQFSGASITGEELLRRTGWNVVIDAVTTQASAVCQINDIGCGAEDCFCQCRGGVPCDYWSYWHWVNDDWEYANTGPSMYSVTDGDLEGWSWGPGNWVVGAEPPPVTFAEICEMDVTEEPVTIPEPATLLLLASGLAGLAGYARMRARRGA